MVEESREGPVSLDLLEDGEDLVFRGNLLVDVFFHEGVGRVVFLLKGKVHDLGNRGSGRLLGLVKHGPHFNGRFPVGFGGSLRERKIKERKEKKRKKKKRKRKRKKKKNKKKKKKKKKEKEKEKKKKTKTKNYN